MAAPGSVRLVDTTLRDGAQMPGAVLRRADRMRIAGRLSAAGVRYVEAGFPASSPEERAHITALVRGFPVLCVSVWSRARRDDIETAARTGADTVHVSFPVSEGHMRILGWNGARVRDELAGIVRMASGHFRRVTVGAQDATRAHLPFLAEFAELALAAGASEMRIADTVGTATPDRAASLVTYLRRSVPGLPLEFHGHDDFGLAAANTLAALQAGAGAASVTVRGVGERSGNAALEQVAAAAAVLYGAETGIDLTALPELCRTVGDAFGLPEVPVGPVIGRNSFSHESGIHCHGMLRDKTSYQPCSASRLGREERYVVGPHAGASTLQALAAAYGRTLDRTVAAAAVEAVKRSLPE